MVHEAKAWRRRLRRISRVVPAWAVGLALVLAGCGSPAAEAPREVEGALTWNRTDPDALTNGNTEVAIRQMHSAPSALQGSGGSADIAGVLAAPWRYAGQVVTAGGQVSNIFEFPPNSDWLRVAGRPGELVYLMTPDGTAIELVNMGDLGRVRRGGFITFRGYPAGYVMIATGNGGAVQGLRVVGVVEDLPTAPPAASGQGALPAGPPSIQAEFRANWQAAATRVGRTDWASSPFRPSYPGASDEAVRLDSDSVVMSVAFEAERRAAMLTATLLPPQNGALRPGQEEALRAAATAMVATLQPDIGQHALADVVKGLGLDTGEAVLALPEREAATDSWALSSRCSQESGGRLGGTIFCLVSANRK